MEYLSEYNQLLVRSRTLRSLGTDLLYIPTVIWLLPTFHATLSASSHRQSGTVYGSTFNHSLQHQLQQLLLSVLNLTFSVWHTTCDLVTTISHTIQLTEIDTWSIINSCTYLLTYCLSV